MGMLVLTRGINDKVLIDTGEGVIEIVIVERKIDGRVRIGIDAPRHMSVIRKELVDQAEATRMGKIGTIKPLRGRRCGG
jgi:carbon storage regulator